MGIFGLDHRTAEYRTQTAFTRPIGAYRRLMARRRLHPAPGIYALAALGGVLPGIGAQLAFGWPWWAVAILVPAAVWAFFFSTVIRGGHSA
ncbi:hypothetical protein [Amycolatopsis sp. H20-H5]|uniref:hypothetical protein n=1 Tax=Amycolatopsis sp. H20-H5 TaxID=3046309 RepID=UPI002DB98141|nr:hypothetical protein [Amycolatopsis sp. H20-H5]MEC3977849.1 hypothetical protein [Amycolatopsis sp. H20-H5]